MFIFNMIISHFVMTLLRINGDAFEVGFDHHCFDADICYSKHLCRAVTMLVID